MTLGEVLTQYPLSILTISTAFAFLWLALYVFRVNPEDNLSKLASGAMITIFLYLLSNFMVGTATSKTQIVFYQRALWWLPFAPVLWLHLSQKATQPLRFRGNIRHLIGNIINATRTNSIMGAFYGIAALFFLAGVFTDILFELDTITSESLPLKNQGIPLGPGHFLFTIFVLLMASIAWINFLSAWWIDSKNSANERFLRHGILKFAHTTIPFCRSPYRSQFWWLSLGGVLFWTAAIGLLISGATDIKGNIVTGNKILALGVLIVAIAILRHNALLKKEALEKDAIYVSIGALGITAIYAAAVFIGQGSIMDVPVTALVFITILALSSHMLADTLKVWFGQFIGTRFGLFSTGDVDKMKQLYQEAARVARRSGPAVELFDDNNKSVDRLLGLLTARQQEIISLRARGLSDKQIANALNIKLPTVRKHIEDIKNRIGSRDKADCAVYCILTGLLSKEDLLDWFDSLNIDDTNV